jgi:hypothetical protein
VTNSTKPPLPHPSPKKERDNTVISPQAELSPNIQQIYPLVSAVILPEPHYSSNISDLVATYDALKKTKKCIWFLL